MKIPVIITVAVMVVLALQRGYTQAKTAVPAPEWNQLFENKDGWIGADFTGSLPLPGAQKGEKRRTLWLFDDTIYGKIKDGKRYDAHMPRNSVAILYGDKPDPAKIQYYFNGTGKESSSYLVPPDGKGWFWFGGAFTHGKTLTLLLHQFENAGEGAFGFKLTGFWLAQTDNIADSPDHWKFKFTQLPFEDQTEGKSRFFGIAALVEGEQVYITGISEDRKNGGMRRNLLMAQVPIAAISDPASWRFYSDGRLVQDWKAATSLCGEDLGTEMSLTRTKQGVELVYSPCDLSPDIRHRTAPSPTGPWSKAVTVYRAPEGSRPDVFCYAGKAHAEFSTPDSLLISYASNSFKGLGPVMDDATLYVPRFIHLRR